MGWTGVFLGVLLVAQLASYSSCCIRQQFQGIKTPEIQHAGEFLVMTGSKNVTSTIHESLMIPSIPLAPSVLRNAHVVQLTEEKEVS